MSKAQTESKRLYKAPVKKDGDKNLRFTDCTPDMQAGLLRSREAEWDKWTTFNAGVVLQEQEIKELRDAGITIQLMQWVETDKAAHKRREGGPFVEPILKSRLVGCGNFEDTDGIFPTVLLEMLILTTSHFHGPHQTIAASSLQTYPMHICKAKKSTESFSIVFPREASQGEALQKVQSSPQEFLSMARAMLAEDSGCS